MKHITFVIMLTVLFAFTGMYGCKHAEPASGSSPKSATETTANASQTAKTQQAQTDEEDSAEEQVDLTKVFNPSYSTRPVKEAFYNQVELKLNGKFTHAVAVTAVITDPDKQLCANNDCASTIHFEDETIAPAHVVNSLNLDLTNLGDLDGDGNDELGAIPEWWSSVWQAYHVLTYKKGGWYEMFMPPLDVNTEYLREHPYIPVERIPEKPGFVRARMLDFDTGELEEMELEIPGVLLDMNENAQSAETSAN